MFTRPGKLCVTLVVPPLDDSIPPGVDEVGSQTGYRWNLGFKNAKVGFCIWQHVLKYTICIRYDIYIYIIHIYIYNVYYDITYFIILKYTYTYLCILLILSHVHFLGSTPLVT